jgi:hypothetical protein
VDAGHQGGAVGPERGRVEPGRGQVGELDAAGPVAPHEHADLAHTQRAVAVVEDLDAFSGWEGHAGSTPAGA